MKPSKIKEIFLKYEKRRDYNKYDLEKRKKEVYEKIPKIKEIDNKIFEIGLALSKAVLNSPDKLEELVAKSKIEMKNLNTQKKELLLASNISLDYLDEKFTCVICKDTGFLKNGGKCNCLKQEIVNEAYKMSNLSRILEKENFNHFDANIFSEEKFEDKNISPRENMLYMLSVCEDFVFNFDKDNGENLLFQGTTGLGKTFMCNCIAKDLLDKGNTVIYQTAFKILEIIESYKFRKDTNPLTEENYKLLFECDLLVIDDLGTEVTNSFTNSEIFNIVNTRIIAGKKTIISTNLTLSDIARTYTERIISRILDHFRVLQFFGKDLRWEK